MGDGPGRRTSKTGITCIFCGRSGVAKAHFWPGWALRAAQIKAGATEKGHLACKKCQSEWIDTIEGKVEVAAGRLIAGTATVVPPGIQTALAQWITLKVMETEQDHPGTAIIPQHDRNALRASGTIPAYVTIWITRCSSPKWRNAYASPIAIVSPAAEPPPTNGATNAKTVSFGIGELFAYVVICRAETVNLNDFIKFEEPVLALWPLAENDIAWPPSAAIHDKEADAISKSLETLVRHPNIKLRAQAVA